MVVLLCTGAPALCADEEEDDEKEECAEPLLVFAHLCACCAVTPALRGRVPPECRAAVVVLVVVVVCA